MSANARASINHKQSHTKHIHVQLLSICLHHSPRSHDFCPIKAYHYPVGKATAMDMVDDPATAGFLASPWRATGTSNTGSSPSISSATLPGINRLIDGHIRHSNAIPGFHMSYARTVGLCQIRECDADSFECTRSSVRLLTFFLESTHLHTYSGLRYMYVYSCLRIFLAFPLPGID